MFGPGGAQAVLTVRCLTATRQVQFVRAGASNAAEMVVTTSFGAVKWPALPTGASVVATRAAGDAALDQIAYSRGRFALEAAGLAPLALPAWPEIARVIEDCRG